MDYKTSLVKSQFRIDVLDKRTKEIDLRNNIIRTDTNISRYRVPQTRTYTPYQYGLDSEGNPEGTIVGFTQGGLFGQGPISISGATSGYSTGEPTTLPLTSATLYTSISIGDLGSDYAVIWIGYFKPPTTGTYTVYTASDDGSAVWFGDAALSGSTASNATLNNNYGGGQGITERSATISLTADVFYPIRIVTLEGGGGAGCTFNWSGPGISKTTDLTQYFYYAGDGSDFSNSSSIRTVGGNNLGFYDFIVDSIASANQSSDILLSNHIISVDKSIKNTVSDVDLSAGSGSEPTTSTQRWTLL